MEAFARRFRCVCLDMDNTLCTNTQHTDGHDRVTEDTAAALREFQACGGTVVVATGRPSGASTRVVDRDLPGVVRYIVCYDGGCVLERDEAGEWQRIWQSGLSGACVARLLAAVPAQLSCSFGVQLHTAGFDGFGVYGSIISSPRLREVLEEANPESYIAPQNLAAMVLNGHRTADEMSRRSPTVLPPEEFYRQLTAAADVTVGWVRIVADVAVDGTLQAELQPLLDAENEAHGSDVAFVSDALAGPTAVVRQAGTDKAVALAAVVEMLGCSAEDCCAFGDGDNDVGMFRWAGCRVCPSNAVSEAKALATTVSRLSNNEDFIADFFTRPLPSNSDEAKVLPYTLPDPLVGDNGARVTVPEEWPARREQILDAFRTHVYGRTPGAEDQEGAVIAEHSVTSREDGLFGGLGTRLEGCIKLEAAQTGVVRTIPVLAYLPTAAVEDSAHKAPMFLGLNFSGNHTVHADPGITESTVLEDPPILPSHRGAQAELWQVEMLLRRGFALLTVYSGDISSDTNNKAMPHDSVKNQTADEVFESGCHALFGQRHDARDPEGWGSIGIWAWGLSRAMDFVEHALAPEVDASRVAVIGHSRKGKTALWAAAQDKRFALAVSNASGAGGAALSRRNFGETIDQMTWRFPTWFCPAFRRYARNEDALPVDQHSLLSAIAPRPLYVASAEDDLHCDPRGEFLSIRAADPVFALLLGKRRTAFFADDAAAQDEGMAALRALEEGPVNVPVGGAGGQLRYHRRSGVHDVTRYDWEQYLAFADEHFGMAAAAGATTAAAQGRSRL
jgi:hydroxymethylpyrimidine pyrophosphatase-like HAD family hydrolase